MNHFADLTTTLEDQEPEARYGDGVSRPVPGQTTEMFRVLVRQPGVGPMRVTFPAETAEKALDYAKARWPSAVIRLA